MVDFLTQNSAGRTATIAKTDVSKLLTPCLCSAIPISARMDIFKGGFRQIAWW